MPRLLSAPSMRRAEATHESVAPAKVQEGGRKHVAGLVRAWRPFLKLMGWLALLIFQVGFVSFQVDPSTGRKLGGATEKYFADVLPDEFSDFEIPLTWVKFYITDRYWKDPVCGDGVCEEPYEFPAYGRFGCRADCGDAKDAVDTLVTVSSDFRHPSMPEDALFEIATWNLCRRDDERLQTGLDDVCYYADDIPFSNTVATDSEAAKLAPGDWYFRVSNDPAGRSSGAIVDQALVDAHGVDAAAQAATDPNSTSSRVVLKADQEWNFCATPKLAAAGTRRLLSSFDEMPSPIEPSTQRRKLSYTCYYNQLQHRCRQCFSQ